MPEYNTDVNTAAGEMDCFVALPQGKGPFPPVILYMDVPGIREELKSMTRHLADNGYLGVLPDLYYREGRVRFDLRKGEEELQKMFAAGSKLTNAMIIEDTRGILTCLAELDYADQSVGIIGYCMSGQFVLTAAGTFPEQIKGAASLYGTRMVTDKDDSPHKLISSISGELYLGFAEHDPYVENFVIPTLKDDLDAAGVVYQLEVFADTEHGFCFPQRPAYARAAADKVWQDVFAMYQRTLS